MSQQSLGLAECLTRAADIELDSFYNEAILTQILTALAETGIDYQEPYTGNSIKTAIEESPSEEQTAILNTSIEMKSSGEDIDMSEILANVDHSGGKIRPIIASLMAILLIVSVVAYGCLVWKISYENSTLPTWDALIIPIGIPVTIVWSYFGFLKAERREFMEAVINKTPAGAAIANFGSRLADIKKQGQ